MDRTQLFLYPTDTKIVEGSNKHGKQKGHVR